MYIDIPLFCSGKRKSCPYDLVPIYMNIYIGVRVG